MSAQPAIKILFLVVFDKRVTFGVEEIQSILKLVLSDKGFQFELVNLHDLNWDE
jgi:hypothetical protein